MENLSHEGADTMSEHDSGTGRNGNGGDPADRLAAHERLSTGALARWYRACATHPRRVFLSWLGIFVVLIALVATIGGSLKDEFDIPGSDTQKATDLIESEFASEQGGVLNLVFAAPPGQRLDTPERKEAIEDAIAELKGPEFKPTEDEAGIESVSDPFDPNTFSDDGRIAYAEAQFDRVIFSRIARPSSLFRMQFAKRSLRPASRSSTTATPSSRRSSRESQERSAC